MGIQPQESLLSPDEELIVGDYYDGAYGPTLILVLASSDAAKWLQQTFREVAQLAVSRVLTEDPRVRIENVERLVMVRAADGPRLTLKRVDTEGEAAFAWAGTEDGWLYLADLIQPFCDGQSGHHYLTEAKTDDAVVELSLGEQHGPR